MRVYNCSANALTNIICTCRRPMLAYNYPNLPKNIEMVLFTASLADDALIFRLCHLLRLTFAHNECRAVLCFIQVLRISSYLSLNILSFLFSKVTEFTKLASTKWKAMNEDDRKPWDERAALDKQRYEKEMESYIPPPGMSGPKSRKKVRVKYTNDLFFFGMAQQNANYF